MQTFIYLAIAILVILQSFVQVTGTDTTTQSTIHTTTSAKHHIDVSTMQTHLDNSLVNSNSKELAANEAIESSEKVTLDHDTQIKVEKNLLSIFGMTKRPTPIDRSKVVIPDAMKALYAEIMGEELRESVNLPKPGLHTKSANTVRSFTHEESKIDERFLYHHRFRLFFNVTGIPKTEKLKAAELDIKRDPILDGTNLRHKILAFDIVRPGIKGKTEPVLYLIDTKTVHINTSETLAERIHHPHTGMYASDGVRTKMKSTGRKCNPF